MLASLAHRLNDLLHRPLSVFWICAAVFIASVILDGSFIDLWSLHRNQDRLHERIRDSKARLHQLEFRIQEAQQPQFIERQARDQFDLVKEGDLIFIFSDDETIVPELENSAKVP